ncbi:MAG: uracil-DNA glycosylase, partial [Candidatus Cloacimonetes bacterium]|nr:uracil-DNA glycosylase [Candidatus Cloacimonadota bacterium]
MDIAALNDCQRCDLHKTRTNILLGEGDLKAQIMFVAQAPGEIEDKENRMFMGPSGQMLDKLFAAAGIIRNKVYITNLIKCHLPGNRRPKQREIKACSVFLEEEIRIIKPQIIVPLGYYATQYLFSRYSSRQLTRKEYPGLIGKVYPMQDLIIFPVSHPASLLYNHEFIAGNILN